MHVYKHTSLYIIPYLYVHTNMHAYIRMHNWNHCSLPLSKLFFVGEIVPANYLN